MRKGFNEGNIHLYTDVIVLYKYSNAQCIFTLFYRFKQEN